MRTVFPPLRESSHRGIPVLTRELPGPVTGTLHFGVGLRDEPLRLMGVTHLLEHLVFAGFPEPSLPYNACVEADRTSFWATGTPDEVAGFLGAVVRALSSIESLTDEQVEREKKILAIENPRGCVAFEEGLLTYRFGTSGLGKAHLGEPTVSAVTRANLVAWARRWMTASNAVLTFTGPAPDSLELDLPTGPDVVRLHEASAGLPGRTLVLSGKSGVAFSLVTADSEPELLTAAVVHEVKARLRHRDGLVYSVDSWQHRDDDSTWHCSFALDPLPGDAARAAGALVALLDELRTRELAEAAVSAAATTRRVDLEYVNTATGEHLDELAVDRLRGRKERTMEDFHATVQEDPAELRARLSRSLRDALGTVQVAVDDDVDADDPALTATGLPVVNHSAWTTDAVRVRGRRFRPRRAGEVRSGATLTVGRDRLQLRGHGEQDSIPFADLILLGRREDGCLVLVDRRGRRAAIDPQDWTRGQAAVELVLERCPDVPVVAPFAIDPDALTS